LVFGSTRNCPGPGGLIPAFAAPGPYPSLLRAV